MVLTEDVLFDSAGNRLDTSDLLNKIKRAGRPSPRTQGVQIGTDPETGEPTQYTFQKFGTQQLQFVTPPKLGTPYQGVQQRDTGYNFKGITTSVIPYPRTGIQSVFSERFQSGITGATPTPLRETALAKNQEIFDEMGLPDLKLPDLGDLFGNGKENGEDCGWFGEKCWGKEKENGEDCGWFGEKCWGKEKEIGEDCGWFGEKCWFKLPDWDLGWIKWVLLAVGIGILLYLLRPLFGLAKNLTEK